MLLTRGWQSDRALYLHLSRSRSVALRSGAYLFCNFLLNIIIAHIRASCAAATPLSYLRSLFFFPSLIPYSLLRSVAALHKQKTLFCMRRALPLTQSSVACDPTIYQCRYYNILITTDSLLFYFSSSIAPPPTHTFTPHSPFAIKYLPSFFSSF